MYCASPKLPWLKYTAQPIPSFSSTITVLVDGVPRGVFRDSRCAYCPRRIAHRRESSSVGTRLLWGEIKREKPKPARFAVSIVALLPGLAFLPFRISWCGVLVYSYCLLNPRIRLSLAFGQGRDYDAICSFP